MGALTAVTLLVGGWALIILGLLAVLGSVGHDDE
jgi:hypothetical protein